MLLMSKCDGRKCFPFVLYNRIFHSFMILVLFIATATTEKITSATVATEKINSDKSFQHEERFIYVGSSGLLVIVVFILITYICFKKKRRKTELDTANSKERDQCSNLDKHLVHGMKDETNTDENDYDEIDDSFLSDIKMSRDEKHDLDSVEDDERSQSIEEDINGGYLNPYQPIISVEIDVHQYKSTKNEEEISTTSDENLRDSWYLHPYQPFVTNLTEVKHEYIGIKHLHTGCTGTQTKGRQGDNGE